MPVDLELHPESQDEQFVAVFTTGKIVQFEMALDVLRQAHFPVLTQENTGTGMKLSMPVAPTPGPGVFWSLSVPEKALGDARNLLSELPFPITTNPAPWDFLPDSTSVEARADDVPFVSQSGGAGRQKPHRPCSCHCSNDTKRVINDRALSR